MKIHLYPLPFYCEFHFFGRTVILKKKPKHFVPRRITSFSAFRTVEQQFYLGARVEIQSSHQNAAQKAAEVRLFEDDGEE